MTPALPGQYISVKAVLPEGLRQVRQYFLSGEAGTSRSFTTKLDDGGEVSPVLHNTVQVGDILESFPLPVRAHAWAHTAEGPNRACDIGEVAGRVPSPSLRGQGAGKGTTTAPHPS